MNTETLRFRPARAAQSVGYDLGHVCHREYTKNLTLDSRVFWMFNDLCMNKMNTSINTAAAYSIHN